jgi:ParB-like chromosome segregation protein Spo0J
VNEPAGDHQNLHSDHSAAFVEEDALSDDALEKLVSEDETHSRRSRPAREGLPAGFRMRHEAHYVDDLTTRSVPSIRPIAVSEIDCDRRPPSAAASLESLADAIRRVGVLQPLLVAPRRGRFQVIDGARRLEAAVLTGLHHVPCIVHDVDEASAQDMRGHANVPHDSLQARDQDEQDASILPGLAADLAGRLELADAQAGLLARMRGVPSRASLDVLHAELAHAARVARAAVIVLDSPHLRRREATAQDLVQQAASATAVARRLAGVRLVTSIDDPDFRVPVDVSLITQALSGSIDALLALNVCGNEEPGLSDAKSDAAHALALSVQCTKTRPAMIIELAQRAVGIEPELIGQFFDATSALHPGGPSGAVLLAAAARIIRGHGGRADVRRDGPVGCTITFVLPQNTSRSDEV